MSSKILEDMRDVMRRRHYSIRTERSYCDWVKRFVLHFNMKSRDDLSEGEKKIEKYLTFLARDRNVVPSTQNQALNALVFFYKHVLKQPLNEKINAERAAKKLWSLQHDLQAARSRRRHAFRHIDRGTLKAQLPPWPQRRDRRTFHGTSNCSRQSRPPGHLLLSQNRLSLEETSAHKHPVHIHLIEKSGNFGGAGFHSVDNKNDSSPLIQNLFRQGMIRTFVNEDETGVYELGGLDVTDDFNIIGADGRPHPHVCALGIPVEGKFWFNVADAWPDVNSNAIAQLSRWAEKVVSRLTSREEASS